MTYLKAIEILKENNIELSEIKSILSLFNFDFDLVGINGDKEIDYVKFNNILKLIKKEYPIAYIVKHINIDSLNIYVDENVLIPRTETIEFVRNYLFKHFVLNNQNVLDLCCGSGIISLLIKKHFVDCNITGSDISDKALEIARLNANNNNLNINFIKSDFFKSIKGEYDFIISNPPYIKNNEKNLKIKYEPKLALFAGDDGLSAYREIFSSIDNYLKDNGYAFFEMESNNYLNIIDLFKKYNKNYETFIYKDMENKPRYLIVKKVI